MKKIGLIIADESEYKMIRARARELDAVRNDFFSREGHRFLLPNDKNTEVYSILCGVGTVNATAAATYLASLSVDMIISFGLSGGISGISKNQFMVGTEYIEHDFDLTPLGYAPCEKPLQNYIHKGNEELINIFCEQCPFIKKGVIVSGDSFICDNDKKEFFKKNYNAMSCDMESSAIAYVCELAEIPFTTLRKISDDAGDDANESYTDSLNIDGVEVMEILLCVMEKASATL